MVAVGDVIPEMGGVVEEQVSEGECLTNPALLELALPLLPPACEAAEDKLARVEASRGLLAVVEVTRDRLPVWSWPLTWVDMGGAANELLDEVDECLLATCLLAEAAAALKVRLVGDAQAGLDGFSLELVGRASAVVPAEGRVPAVEIGVTPRRGGCRVVAVFHATPDLEGREVEGGAAVVGLLALGSLGG